MKQIITHILNLSLKKCVMKINILVVVLILILLLIVSINLISWIRRYVLFQPSQELVWEPPIPHDDVFVIPTSGNEVRTVERGSRYAGESIHTWHFDFGGDKVILFCHGNSGNISHRDYIIDFCRRFGLNLLLFDYRGYGISKGYPTVQNIKNDGIYVYNYLTTIYIPDDIIIWSESLGGFPALHIASKYPCFRLILMCPFSGLDDIISNKMGIEFSKILPIFMDIMANKELIKYVQCPVAIVHSDTDEVIPFECALKLYHSIQNKQKIFLKIKGYHASPIIEEHQLVRLLRFCDMSCENLNSKDLCEIVKNIQTVAERHKLIKRRKS